MTEYVLIYDLAVVWAIALIASYICARIKQPSIAGYIISGVLIGPHGLGLINQSEQISALAEFGVALLLFALGVEVSIKQIFGSNKKVIISGLLQLGLTALLTFIIMSLSSPTLSPTAGILFGFICALSSTTIITKLLMDRAETDSIHGRILIPILVIQDLSLIPLISIISIPDSSFNVSSVILLAALKAVLLIGIIFVGATKLVPALLNWVTKYASREIFLLTVISLCLGVALMSKQLGLSLALGAFLAGIMISESKFGHQALADLLPLSDLFAIVFFVSIGMFVDPIFIANHWLEVSVFVVLLIIGKTVVGTIAALFSTTSLWSSILVGVGLAQIGEFSFVLASIAHQAHIIDDALFNLFFAGAVVSLIATPLLMTAVPRLFKNLFFHKFGKSDAVLGKNQSTELSTLKDHVVLCGYGRIGKNVGRVLKKSNIPFVVIDVNGNLVNELQESDVPYVFGNAFSRHVLLKAGIAEADCLIMTLPDPIAAITIISFARHYNSNIKIIARAHRTDDIEIYKATGADAVVQPEFEASIEIARLALLNLNIDNNSIQEALNEIRSRRYQLFQTYDDHSYSDINTFTGEDFTGKWFKVNNSLLLNKTIGGLDVRKKTGTIILAIKREAVILPYPTSDNVLADNDEIYVVGGQNELKSFEEIFQVRLSNLSNGTLVDS